MMGKTKKLSDKHPESIVLVLQGCFYHAEGRSAEALASITGYKLRDMKNGGVECGFPFGSLDKIKKILEDKGINYIIYQKNEITHQYSKGSVLLDEYLKDANIPPPISKDAREKQKESCENHSDIAQVELVPITFRCPKVLLDRLKVISEREWQISFDAIVARILEKGLKDG